MTGNPAGVLSPAKDAKRNETYLLHLFMSAHVCVCVGERIELQT